MSVVSADVTISGKLFLEKKTCTIMLKRALYSIGKEEAVPYIYNSWYKGRFAAAYLGFCEGNDE